MANIATSNTTFQQMNSLSQLPIVRQLGFMLVVAGGIALGIATVLWSMNAEHTALYQNMSTQDSSSVITALEQSGVQYKINSSSGIITVPSNQVQQIRMQLANSGLPRSSNRGFAMLEEEQNLGTSNFIEQARYNRALEQELVQTISHIQGVRDARVHLSIPKQSSFIRNSRNPSASVMIDLVNVQSLNETQLMGIVHLVASSISGMEAEDVSIIDQRGTLLSQSNNSEFNSTNENIRLTRGIEEDYSNRILDILTPIVGAGNVRAQVSAELDFTIIETTEETYNPDAVVVRSEQIQEETSGLGNAGVVEPGTLSPIPPADNDDQTQAASNQSRLNSTRNFEIDRSVSLIRTVPGTVNRLSVAVLIDLHSGEALPETGLDEATTNLDQQKIERLTQLIRDTIGYNEARGDSVNIISEQFVTIEELEPAEELAIWQQSWVIGAVKQLGAGIVVLLLIFVVLRPAMKSVVSSQGSLPNKQNLNLPASSSGDIDDDTVSLSSGSEALTSHSSPAKSQYDDNLNLAQELVENEPTRAARMIQNWVADD